MRRGSKWRLDSPQDDPSVSDRKAGEGVQTTNGVESLSSVRLLGGPTAPGVGALEDGSEIPYRITNFCTRATDAVKSGPLDQYEDAAIRTGIKSDASCATDQALESPCSAHDAVDADFLGCYLDAS